MCRAGVLGPLDSGRQRSDSNGGVIRRHKAALASLHDRSVGMGPGRRHTYTVAVSPCHNPTGPRREDPTVSVTRRPSGQLSALVSPGTDHPRPPPGDIRLTSSSRVPTDSVGHLVRPRVRHRHPVVCHTGRPTLPSASSPSASSATAELMFHVKQGRCSVWNTGPALLWQRSADRTAHQPCDTGEVVR